MPANKWHELKKLAPAGGSENSNFNIQYSSTTGANFKKQTKREWKNKASIKKINKKH